MVPLKLRRPNRGGLFQLRRYRGKGGVELRAKALHDADHRDRNTSGDQAIFDGGRTGLIGQELAAFSDHGAG